MPGCALSSLLSRLLSCLSKLHFPPNPLSAFSFSPSLHVSSFTPCSSIILLRRFKFSLLAHVFSPPPVLLLHFRSPSFHVSFPTYISSLYLSSPSLHILSFTPILSFAPYLLLHSISSPSLYVSSGTPCLLPFVRPLFIHPSGIDVWRMSSVACVIASF